MTNSSPLSLGGSKSGNAFTGTFATDNDNWLKVFGGEVLSAFEKAIEISPKLTTRTISSGKSATFPITGRANARNHKPGDDILAAANTSIQYQDAISAGGATDGRPQDWTADLTAEYLSNLGASERIININDLMIASVFIDDLDEVKAYYDLRSTYTVELGRALARKMDNLCARSLFAAAGTIAEGAMRGGQSILDGNMLTQADVMASSIMGAAQKLDEYDIPKEDRMCILNPAGYYLLLRAAGGAGTGADSYAALLSQDYSMGNGDFAEGRVLMVGGIPVVVSNNAGFGVNFTQEAGENNELAVDMSNAAGLVAHKSATGILKLKDLQLEHEYMIQNQGNLFVSKLACGVAPLRTDGAIKLVTA
jgi:hypothetical protein